MSANTKNIYNERFEQSVTENTFVNGGIQSISFIGDGEIFDDSVQSLGIGDSGTFVLETLDVPASSVLMGPVSGSGKPTWKQLSEPVQLNAGNISFQGDGVLHSSTIQTIDAGDSGVIVEVPVQVTGPQFFMGPETGDAAPTFRIPNFEEVTAGWSSENLSNIAGEVMTALLVSGDLLQAIGNTTSPLYSAAGFSSGADAFNPSFLVDSAGNMALSGSLSVSGPFVFFANAEGFFECMMNAEFKGDFSLDPKLCEAEAAINEDPDPGVLLDYIANNPFAVHNPDTQLIEPHPAVFAGSAVSPHYTCYDPDSQFRVGLFPSGPPQGQGGVCGTNGPGSRLEPVNSLNFGFRHMSTTDPEFYFYNKDKSPHRSKLYAGSLVCESDMFAVTDECSIVMAANQTTEAATIIAVNDEFDSVRIFSTGSGSSIPLLNDPQNPEGDAILRCGKKRSYLASNETADGLDIIQLNLEPDKRIRLVNPRHNRFEEVEACSVEFTGHAFYSRNIFSTADVITSPSDNTWFMYFDSARYQYISPIPNKEIPNVANAITRVVLPRTTAIPAYQSYVLYNDTGFDVSVLYSALSGNVIFHTLKPQQMMEYVAVNQNRDEKDWIYNKYQAPTGTGGIAGVNFSAPSLFNVVGSGTDTVSLSYSSEFLPILNGGTGLTAVPTEPVASTYAAWDVNEGLSANNISYAFINSSSTGTFTVFNYSPRILKFTGPPAAVKFTTQSTFSPGQVFEIVNQSSNDLQVQYTSAVGVATNLTIIPGGQMNRFVCTSATGTSQAWKYYTFTSSTTNTVSVEITQPNILKGETDSGGNVTIDYSGETLPIVNGGTGVDEVPIFSSPSNFAAWDPYHRLHAKTFIDNFQVVDNADSRYTIGSGQNSSEGFPDSTVLVRGNTGRMEIVLPDPTEVFIGQKFNIKNDSSNIVEIGGLSQIGSFFQGDWVVYPGSDLEIVCLNNTSGSYYDPTRWFAPSTSTETHPAFLQTAVEAIYINPLAFSGIGSVPLTTDVPPIMTYTRIPLGTVDAEGHAVYQTNVHASFTVDAYSFSNFVKNEGYFGFTLAFEVAKIYVDFGLDSNIPTIKNQVTVSLQAPRDLTSGSTRTFFIQHTLPAAILYSGWNIEGINISKPVLLMGTLNTFKNNMTDSAHDSDRFRIEYLNYGIINGAVKDTWIMDFNYLSI